ncbi:MAG: PIN domain-containing protein [Gemmataceae bacterium]
MPAFLLDTQIVCYLFDEAAPEHANVKEHYRRVPAENQLFISSITIGEIAFGHAKADGADLQKQQKLQEWLKFTFPFIIDVTKVTAPYYGEIRGNLFRKFAPKGKGRRPESCYDPATSKELGIQENDLWIASQAYEKNLCLVTNDKMNRIQEVTESLIVFKNWTRFP